MRSFVFVVVVGKFEKKIVLIVYAQFTFEAKMEGAAFIYQRRI
jgi:hypothetical protein